MTKQELMETYTAEQLVEMVEKLDNENTGLKKEILKKTGLCGEAKVSFGFNGPECRCGGYDIAVKKNKELQSEVEKYRKAFEDAKKERDCQIAEYQNRSEKDKTELERAKNTINQIDDILEKLFGVRHDTVDKPDEFEKILHERIKGNVTDFLPTEPIKVADMLINAEGEYEHNPVVKKICGTDKGKYRIFDVLELRQIAEHLLVYCNHNKEEKE